MQSHWVLEMIELASSFWKGFLLVGFYSATFEHNLENKLFAITVFFTSHL